MRLHVPTRVVESFGESWCAECGGDVEWDGKGWGHCVVGLLDWDDHKDARDRLSRGAGMYAREYYDAELAVQRRRIPEGPVVD